MSNIVKLEAENIKRLKAVQIEPNGSVVIVGGRNAQGKSSVIDAIEMALAGKRSVPERPIRDGEEKAHIICDLGDLVVKRTFRNGDGKVKSTLKVESKDGAVYKSPQAMLDKLVGELSFDPLAFCRLEAKAQAETLRKLVGVDTSDIDKTRADLYQERTSANVEVAKLRAVLDNSVFYEDVPKDELSVSELIKELEAAQDEHRQYRDLELDYSRNKEHIDLIVRGIEKKYNEMGKLQSDIDTLKSRLIAAEKEATEFEELLAGKSETLPDVNPIRDKIASSEDINKKVRENKQRSNLIDKIQEARDKAEKLTKNMQEIDKHKADLLADARFPVEGLSFDTSGVLLNGIPFSQGSSAEQLKVSIAMGLAMNPELKIILIRDGSLLDEESLQIVRDMAAEAGAQVWLERVSTGDEVSVVIEDGEVL